jgi:hypothetical protein
MGIREIVIMLILVTAGISFYFGRKITLEWLDDDIKRKAFESAKEQYVEYLCNNFTLDADQAVQNIMRVLAEENEELIKENEQLRKRLKRKKK